MRTLTRPLPQEQERGKEQGTVWLIVVIKKMSDTIRYHLAERCLIKLSGDDAESFLQTLVTQDVLRLEEGRLIYACLLTPRGRFLHDFFIFKEGRFFLPRM